MHNYYYDHSGERALKRFGNSTKVGVDAGDSQSVTDDADGYSAYFSPYFVETQGGRYTKHYYAGTQRMASMVDVMQKGMGEEPGQASGQASGQPSGQPSGQASEEEKDAIKDCQKMQQMKAPGYDAGGAGKADAEAAEPDLYYYHTDHLGSTSIITDRNGEVAQYAAYTPYGETFIEEKSVMPYKFNGKELDAETGLYYYGARYYDPGLALWLGVDPLAEKYPDVSPYVYCAGNPVKYVDPDGREKLSIHIKMSVGIQWGFKASSVVKKILPEKVGDMLEIKANLYSVELLDVSVSFDTESNKMDMNCNYVGEKGRCKVSQGIDVCGFAAEHEWDSASNGYVKNTHKVNLSTPFSETTIDNQSTDTATNVSIGEKTMILGAECSFNMTDSNKNFDSNEK